MHSILLGILFGRCIQGLKLTGSDKPPARLSPPDQAYSTPHPLTLALVRINQPGSQRQSHWLRLPRLDHGLAFRLSGYCPGSHNIPILMIHSRSISERHRRFGFPLGTVWIAVSITNTVFMLLTTERT